ncbi:MAG TPA: hypothetical protein VHH36_09010 [Candidatus Thermoplasmatota archaeon]|nr:hypothetical protein [Candidatus Thermoplasmatota archaeon]
MAKAGSVVVAFFAIVLGIFLGFVGVTFLLQGEDLASSRSDSWSFLGAFGESDSEASLPVGPWMGLVFLLTGAGVLVFGLRALFTTFEGRSDLG